MGELFEETETPAGELPASLAERMRPRTLDEVVGHARLLGIDRPFRSMVESGEISSVILWGGPGVGKTTLARLVAARANLPFEARSAVTTGMPEVRALMRRARVERRRFFLFLDEIHRFNKAQQDALLPYVEDGTVVLFGATTENPGFEVIRPLLSRCRVERLEPLTDEDIECVLERAVTDAERGIGYRQLLLDGDARTRIVELASGDARRALLLLEGAAMATPLGRDQKITMAAVDEAAGSRVVGHDRAGDSHFDLASALQKSVRGSDTQAALYYLARMLEGGERPEFAARRLVVCAAEDIGNADPQALVLAVAAQQAVSFLGMPEARIPLAQLAVYLATAPKSNSAIAGYERAAEVVRSARQHDVPPNLRQGGTAVSRAAGHGKGYVLPHDAPNRFVPIDYLPEALHGSVFYEPVELGHEREIARRLAYWADLRRQAEEGETRAD